MRKNDKKMSNSTGWYVPGDPCRVTLLVRTKSPVPTDWLQTISKSAFTPRCWTVRTSRSWDMFQDRTICKPTYYVLERSTYVGKYIICYGCNTFGNYPLVYSRWIGTVYTQHMCTSTDILICSWVHRVGKIIICA